MYNLNDIELSRQRREDVARQVENNRLARQLRAARSRMASGAGRALLGRVFSWSRERDKRWNAEVGGNQVDLPTLECSEKGTFCPYVLVES